MLDVKVGSGALVKTEEQCRDLAHTMVGLGAAHGVPTRALLTDMNRPLGATVGNALEVAEALEVLAGGGPPDVVGLTLRLAAEMLALAGVGDRDPADTLRDGTAMDRFRRFVAAQGGDLSVPLPIGRHSETVTAPRGGTMGDIDRWQWGWRLGGSAREDPVRANGCKPAPASDSPPPRRAGRRRRAAVHPLHRHPGTLRRRAGRAGRRLERRRRRAGAATADHRSDRHMTAPLELEQIRKAPKALLHDHLDGGLRPSTVLDIAGQTGYDGLPATDVEELATWFRTRSHSGSLERYLEPFSHTVAVMQTPRRCTGWRTSA